MTISDLMSRTCGHDISSNPGHHMEILLLYVLSNLLSLKSLIGVQMSVLIVEKMVVKEFDV